MDYHIYSPKSKKTLRTIRGVESVAQIPMGCMRLRFHNGSSCKIKASQELRKVEQ